MVNLAFEPQDHFVCECGRKLVKVYELTGDVRSISFHLLCRRCDDDMIESLRDKPARVVTR